MGKKIAVIVLSAFVLAGCDTPAQTVGLGAGVGAAGAAVVGGNVAVGALIGAGAGLACEASSNCN